MTTHNSNPRVGVAVCIFKDDKILLGQRQKDSSQGVSTWCPPGGKLNFGESFEDCARREIQEEAGIMISEPVLVTCTNDIFPDKSEHFISIFMQANWVSGDPQTLEPHKIADWAWFDWDKMPSPLFSPFQNLISSGFKPTAVF